MERFPVWWRNDGGTGKSRVWPVLGAMGLSPVAVAAAWSGIAPGSGEVRARALDSDAVAMGLGRAGEAGLDRAG